MAGEAPMLVQQVLLPQMRLLVLLVPQVLRRRVYYHVTYFAFAITPPDRLSNNVLARICSSISRTSISASLSFFFLHVSFLLAIVTESLCIENALSLCIENMLIRLSRGVLRAEIQLRTIPRSFVIYKRRIGVHVFFWAYVRFL